MCNTDLLWVEVSVITFLLLMGHIFPGHFERSPRLRKFVKAIDSLVVVIVLSFFLIRKNSCFYSVWIIPDSNFTHPWSLASEKGSEWMDG